MDARHCGRHADSPLGAKPACPSRPEGQGGPREPVTEKTDVVANAGRKPLPGSQFLGPRVGRVVRGVVAYGH